MPDETPFPAVEGWHRYIPFPAYHFDGEVIAFGMGECGKRVAGVINEYMHDEAQAVGTVWNDRVEQVCMSVFTRVTVEAINGYTHEFVIVALIVFRGDKITQVSDWWSAAARTAATLAFKGISLYETLGMLYDISFGIFRTDRGFKVKKAWLYDLYSIHNGYIWTGHSTLKRVAALFFDAVIALSGLVLEDGGQVA